MLRDKGFDGLASCSFADIDHEIKTSCPLFYQFLSAMLEYKHDSDKKQEAFALIYAIIMFRRCHELSKLQRINTVLLIEGGATQQVLNVLYL